MVYLPHFPLPSKKSISSNSAEKLSKILPKLGNPENKLPPVIHISGTNGKGSTATFLASIFEAANYQTHIYTSPHLHHCNERIVINGKQIDDGYLYQILEEVRLKSDGFDLTLFEGLTLAAILAFKQTPADVCIVETGMGGRVDATNVLPNKIATILTSISIDHQEFLGDNLFAIACEKAHIMQTKTPCIIAPQSKETMLAINLYANQISTPLVNFDQNFQIEINDDQSFNFKYSGDNFSESFKNISKPCLEGWHQYLNASLSIATICAIKDFKTANFNISQNAINQGLKTNKWPSRLEKLSHKILTENDELWIDGAHNDGGFSVLADWLFKKIIFDEDNQKPKRNYLIVGFSKNKAKAEFFYHFRDLIDFICAVRVQGEPQPEEAKVIIKKILQAEIKEVVESENLLEAIKFLKNLDLKNPCRIIICGSLYLARDFKMIEY